MRVHVLVVVGLLLAGCASHARDEPLDPAPAAGAPRPELMPPTLRPDLDVGVGDGEPNIAIAPDGTIYLTPISQLYRSTDNGTSFAALGTGKTVGHGDGDTAVDRQGRLHWLGLGSSPDPSIPYMSSDDRGDTWTKPVEMSGTGIDREWIDATPDGWLYATWLDSADSGSVAFRASPDAGQTWTSRTNVAPSTLAGPVTHGPLAGSGYVPLSRDAGAVPLAGGLGQITLELAVTHDHGDSWNVLPVAVPPQPASTEPLIDQGTAIFPVVTADDAGTLYFTWSSPLPQQGLDAPRSASRFGVWLVVSKDDGQTWTEPALVSDPTHSALMPFAAAGAAGRLALVWYENTYGNPSDIAPDVWNTMLWESVDADEGAVHNLVVQLNSQPSHIGSVCSSGGVCFVDGGDRSLLDYFEVALDQYGLPQVVWSASVVGTAFSGVAVQPTHVHFGGVAAGTSLR